MKLSKAKGNEAERQISNRVFQETKRAKFSKKRTFLTVSGGKKFSFFGKFDVLCFLETPALRFTLLPYYQRISGQLFSF